MAFNHSDYVAMAERFAFPTLEDPFLSTDSVSKTSMFQQLLTPHARGEAERVPNMDMDHALNDPIGTSGTGNFSSQHADQTINPFYFQQEPQISRAANPEPPSPQHSNHHSGPLFDPFVDAQHHSSSLALVPGDTLAQDILTPPASHRRAHSGLSPGANISPSRTRCSPSRISRHGVTDEQFVPYETLVAPSHSRQTSSHLDISLTHRTPPPTAFVPLTAPGLPLLFPFPNRPWLQTQGNDDLSVSRYRQDSQSSNSSVGVKPLIQASEQYYFDSVGPIDVRFTNAAKAQAFLKRYDASRICSSKLLQHAPGIDRALGTLPEIDYRNTDNFYPLEPLPTLNQLAMQERSRPTDVLQELIDVDRPDGSVLRFDNGQPDRMQDLQSFFAEFPIEHDPEDTEWATFIDSTYGPRLQRPKLFFHVPYSPHKYPIPKSTGLVLVRFWHQDEREPKLKTGVFTVLRDWYHQSDTLLLAKNPSSRVIIEPTKIVFLERDSDILYFEVPNVPWVWTLIGQLFLCACYPEFPYPTIRQILYKWAIGARRHREASPWKHVVFAQFGDVQPYNDHHDICDYHPFFVEPDAIANIYPAPLARRLLLGYLTAPQGEYFTNSAGEREPAFERNLSFVQFMKQWLIRYRLDHSKVLYELPSPYDKVKFPPILEEAANSGTWTRPAEIEHHQVHTETHDVQGINWRSMGVKRRDARKLRDSLYFPYRNKKHYEPSRLGNTLPDTDCFFRFRRLQTKFKASLAHFQLRNLMSAVDKNCIAWVGEYRVNLTDPNTGRTKEAIRLVDTKDNTLTAAVRLSTMKAGYGVVVAGGFDGEYAINGIGQPSSSQITGILTDNKEAITNYVELYTHRRSSSPYAAFSSNDMVVRIFDVQKNTLVSTQPFPFAVNCTAMSPDGRLRLLVGDDLAAHVVDAETGAPLQELKGHQDYGFACAWSPCGHQVVTGNQDDTIQVFDTRMWRRLAVIASDVAGFRSLAFSPTGGGQRVLVAAEPADRISIIDAQTYTTRQTHDFFGEIGGIDFLPDGSNLVVANLDKKVGGLMWYERSSFGAERGLKHTKRLIAEFEGEDWRDEEPAEWVEGEKKAQVKGVARGRRGLEMGDVVF